MLARALALLAPPLCATCSAPCGATDPICPGCRRALAAARAGAAVLPGIGRVTWAAPYAGIARDLVTALKFDGRLPLAAVAAEAIAPTVELPVATAVVPVPAAPSRRRNRGFDPAQLIAAELARALRLPLAMPLRRADGPRQVGRRRAERMADPPRVRVGGTAPRRALLVDDVLTTGATLTACAAELAASGADEVRAAVFAHALGAPPATA